MFRRWTDLQGSRRERGDDHRGVGRDSIRAWAPCFSAEGQASACLTGFAEDHFNKIEDLRSPRESGTRPGESEIELPQLCGIRDRQQAAAVEDKGTADIPR